MKFDRIRNNLERRGYQVSCFETAAQAAEYLNAQIDCRTVGIGGSVTIDQMGLYDMLCTHNDVAWHWRVPPGDTAMQVLERERRASVYLSSVNAMSRSGEIVNIDGNGNRVSDINFGHSCVYLIIGSNKIEQNLERAIYRARNVAAPKNAQRLGARTPCALKGNRCYNCSSSDRICKTINVLLEKPRLCAYEIILIDEELGY